MGGERGGEGRETMICLARKELLTNVFQHFRMCVQSYKAKHLRNNLINEACKSGQTQIKPVPQ